MHELSNASTASTDQLAALNTYGDHSQQGGAGTLPLSGEQRHNTIGNAEDCDLVEWSHRLHAFGFSLIPLSRSSKRPTVKWKAYQDVRADKDQLDAWFSGRDANIGIVTGSVSGIVVVDADAVDLVKNRCPETPLRTRTSKGMHFYYRQPSVRSFDPLAITFNAKRFR